ncbi:major outer sheath protein Msp [Treponema denticola]|uniref:major outer sheath protein Msp n=1 Tax=Treponema denticola TaxID=158 RepID=UPI0021043AA7|nr:MSP porin [Treponema denticola]UTY24979.1 phage sheath protein [Treponema denticola]
MKKILSILMILALVGGVAFAQLTPEVTASASVNWGIDLGAGKGGQIQHGFENLFSATVDIPLYKGKLNSKTEGDVHMNFDIGLNLLYQFDDAISNSKSPHKSDNSDMKFSLAEDVLSDLAASIHFFGGYMNVYGRPDFSTNFAEIWAPIRDFYSNYFGARPQTKGDITGFGTKLGYASDDLAGTGLKLNAGLKFASNDSWKAKVAKKAGSAEFEEVDLKATEEVKKGEIYYAIAAAIYGADGSVVGVNTTVPHPAFTGADFVVAADTTVGAAAGKYVRKNVTPEVPESETSDIQGKYAIGFDLSLGYDKWVTFDFGINATFNPVKDFGEAGVKAAEKSNKDKAYLGTGFKLGSKPVDGLALNFGMDALMNVGKDSKPAFDIVFDASYKWVKAGVYYGNELSKYAGKKNSKAIGDMAVMLAFKSAASGSTNLVENLAFGVDFRLNHLLSDIDTAKKAILPMGISAWVNYKYAITDSMWIKPYANFWAESNCVHKDTTNTDKFFGVAYKVGTVFAPMEKVEIEASWSQGKLNWNKYEGYKQKDLKGKDHSMLKAPAFDAHNGTFVIGVKVKY